MAEVTAEKEHGFGAGATAEKEYRFEADVPQVMSIITNSVYSSKELFLRELISNSSDALSKMMTEKDGLDKKGYKTMPICTYKIQIIVDEENKTLTIKDNGIGMTRANLEEFLGRIASSGTKKFREALDKSAGANVDALIGQFGLGFYSAFLVAERVDVITRNPSDEGYLWSSDGGSTYSIRPFAVEEEHGTSVILKLKEGEYEYLKADRLTEIVKKHSLYIKYPVSLVTEEKVEAAEKEEEIEGDVEEVKEAEGDVEEVKDDAEKEGAKENGGNKKMVEKVINSEIPVWTKQIKEIPEADLKKFYKSISNDYDDYAAVQSWHFEGIMDLKILLFIRKKAEINFFSKQASTKSTNIKIFNSNVFVTDELSQDVVPEWMSFVVGAVSSSDFPMNISREFLQGKAAIKLLKTKLPKCIAEMVRKLEEKEETYLPFYKEFSSNIKLAVKQYSGEQQETFAKFLRYPTNQDNSKLVSLDQYLALAPETAKQIFILTGLNKAEVETSIYLEGFRDRHVLLMHEAVDEIMLQSFKTYKDIPIQMISAEGVENGAVSVENEAEFTALKEFMQSELKEKVEKVELSCRFEGVPATLLTTKYATSSAMENIIKSHPGAENNPMLMMMLNNKKILEINVKSPIVRLIKGCLDDGQTELVKKYVSFLFQAALISCGFSIDNKAAFVKNLYEIFGEAASKPKRTAGE